MNEHGCVHSVFSRFLSRYKQRTRRTCCLRLTPPRGARLSTPKDPSCQSCFREPLTRFHSHPASFTRPPRSVLQSITLDSSRQGAAERKFRSFPSRRISCNAFNLLDLGAPVKGSISRLFSSPAIHRPFWRQPYKLPAFNRGVNPFFRTRDRRVTTGS